MLDMRDRVRALEAENKRLERDNDGLDDIIADQSRWIGHHKDRILALEAEIAVLRGTMARPEPDDDGPVTLVEGPPNAPR
jgi:hypothetical protein